MDRMEGIKKHIRRRITLMSAGLLALSGLAAYNFVGPGLPVTSAVNPHVLQFQHGLWLGAMVALVAAILRSALALHSEAALKRLYYRITDERMAAVRMRSGAPVLAACAGALLAASLVAMYRSTAVSVTLIACAAFLLAVGVVRKAVLAARATGREE